MNWQKVINKGIDTLVHILLDIEMIQDENDMVGLIFFLFWMMCLP